MTRSRNGTQMRRAVIGISLTAGAFFASCTSKEPAPVDSPTAGPTDPSTSARIAAAATGAGLFQSLDTDPQATRAYINSVHLNFSDERGALQANFECNDKAKCPPNGMVNLKIVPDSRAHNRDWLKILTGKREEGFIVAKIKNMDSRNTLDALQLRPGDSAYLWVGQLRKDDTERGVAFYSINTSSGTTGGPLEIVQTVQHCDDDDPIGSPNSGMTPKVVKGPNHTGAKCWQLSRDGGQLMPIRRRIFPNTGLWISCSGGCCQVERT
jgi:hypothetical protein